MPPHDSAEHPQSGDPADGYLRSGASTMLDVADNPFADIASADDSEHAGVPMAALWQFRWMVIAIAGLIGFAGTAAVWLLVRPNYVATAVIEVAPVVPRIIYPTENTGPIPFYHQFISGQATIATSPTVLNRVIDRPEVRATTWFAGSPNTPLDALLRPKPAIERLTQALSAVVPPGSQFIYLTMKARQARDASLIANAVLSEYLKFAREKFSDEEKQVYEALERERKQLGSDIEIQETEIAELRKRLGTSTPDQLVAQNRLRLDELESLVKKSTMDTKVLEKQLEVISQVREESERGGNTAASSPTVTQYVHDDEWRKRRSELNDAEKRIKLWGEQYGESHPTMQRYRREAELAREGLTDREREIDMAGPQATAVASFPSTGDMITNPAILQMMIEQGKIRAEHQERNFQEENARFRTMFDLAEQLNRKTESLKLQKEKYRAVMQRIDEKDTENLAPVRIRALSEAVEPSTPDDDRRLKFTLGVWIAAFGAGLGAAFLRLRLGPSVRAAEELHRADRGVFLGKLLLYRGRATEDIESCPVQAEYIRTIRTALLNRLGGDGRGVVQITSAEPGSGKSTTARMLARSLAMCGRKVLLVDADLHNPSLAERFGLPGSPGLLDVIANGNGKHHGSLPLATSTPNLWLLPCAENALESNSEALASEQFTRLLRRWRDDYDLIILDTAPLLAAADGGIVAGRVDGTIMIVRQGYSSRNGLVEALSRVAASGGRLLGTVYVGVERSTEAYGYYARRGGERRLALTAQSDESRQSRR